MYRRIIWFCSCAKDVEIFSPKESKNCYIFSVSWIRNCLLTFFIKEKIRLGSGQTYICPSSSIPQLVRMNRPAAVEWKAWHSRAGRGGRGGHSKESWHKAALTQDCSPFIFVRSLNFAREVKGKEIRDFFLVADGSPACSTPQIFTPRYVIILIWLNSVSVQDVISLILTPQYVISLIWLNSVSVQDVRSLILTPRCVISLIWLNSVSVRDVISLILTPRHVAF
jgi:hypothetical protein